MWSWPDVSAVARTKASVYQPIAEHVPHAPVRSIGQVRRARSASSALTATVGRDGAGESLVDRVDRPAAAGRDLVAADDEGLLHGGNLNPWNCTPYK